MIDLLRCSNSTFLTSTARSDMHAYPYFKYRNADGTHNKTVYLCMTSRFIFQTPYICNFWVGYVRIFYNLRTDL